MYNKCRNGVKKSGLYPSFVIRSVVSTKLIKISFLSLLFQFFSHNFRIIIKDSIFD